MLIKIQVEIENCQQYNNIISIDNKWDENEEKTISHEKNENRNHGQNIERSLYDDDDDDFFVCVWACHWTYEAI